jgi:exonuclease VII large subunit
VPRIICRKRHPRGKGKERVIGRQSRQNKAKWNQLERRVEDLEEYVGETNEDMENKVNPKLEKYEEKFEQIEQDLRDIVRDKDQGTQDVLGKVAGLQILSDTVRTQGIKIDQLEQRKTEELGTELELVKKDFIQLKQDVFDLQENENKLNGRGEGIFDWKMKYYQNI